MSKGEAGGGDFYLPRWQRILLGSLLVAGIVSFLWWIPRYAFEALETNLYAPLRTEGLAVRISRGDFLAIGLILPGALLAVVFAYSLVQDILVGTPALPKRLIPLFLAVGYTLPLALIVPVVGGAYYAWEIQSRGYVECPKLFEFGVAKLVHGYVKDPVLCVSKERLAERIAQYQRAAQRGEPAPRAGEPDAGSTPRSALGYDFLRSP